MKSVKSSQKREDKKYGNRYNRRKTNKGDWNIVKG